MIQKTYIEPQQLSAAEIAQVLSALNGAASAGDLAAAVEFPSELDLGVRIAQRIIDRREQLGGGFSNIQELADVPLVGPERFTEIVAALTGRPLPWADTADQAPTLVMAELRALREAVANLQGAVGSRYRIELRPLSPGGFLGQEQLLRARVVETTKGKPKANARLTLVSTWGILNHLVGFAPTRGQVIAVTTDLQGEVKLRYTPPTHELLQEAQRHALESALSRLDRQALTPSDAAGGFQYIAEQYSLERNKALRGAVDIYFREQQAQLVEPMTRSAWMNAWRYRDVLLLAYVQAGESGAGPSGAGFSTSVDSMAALVLRLKDWVGPWFQTLLDSLSAVNDLDTEFERISKSTPDKNLLLERMLSGVHSFVAGRRGLAGELAGQELSDRSITGFLAAGIETLPVDTQLTLHSSLDVAARTIRKAGIGALEAVTQSRTDLKQEMNAKVDQVTGEVNVLNARVNGFDTQLTDIESGFDLRIEGVEREVVDLRNEYEPRVRGVETELQAVQPVLDDFNVKYDTFTTDYGKFNVDYNKFQDDRFTLTNDVSKVTADLQDLTVNYNDFKVEVQGRR